MLGGFLSRGKLGRKFGKTGKKGRERGGGGEMVVQKRRPFSSCRVQRTEAAPLGRRWKRAATLDPRPVHAQWRIDPGESEMHVTSSSGPLAVYRIPFLRSDAAPFLDHRRRFNQRNDGTTRHSDARPSRSRSPTDHTNRQRFEGIESGERFVMRHVGRHEIDSREGKSTRGDWTEVRNFSFDTLL